MFKCVLGAWGWRASWMGVTYSILVVLLKIAGQDLSADSGFQLTVILLVVYFILFFKETMVCSFIVERILDRRTDSSNLLCQCEN